MSKVSRTLITLVVVLASTVAAKAHDLWIEPTSFFPEAGKVMGVRLRVGENLVGDPVPRNSGLIDQFVMAGPAGLTSIEGRAGADPAGLVRISAPGLHVLGYRSKPSPITMPGDKFSQYLREEGLEHVLAARAARGQARADGREQFARCAKSLVLTGPAPDAQGDRVLGFTLELVAEKNPYAVPLDEDLPVKLLYAGRPLASALVVAINRRDPGARVMARSDKEGRVRLRLDRPGLWLVKAVHMVPDAPGSAAEWLSYWASLTFERPSS